MLEQDQHVLETSYPLIFSNFTYLLGLQRPPHLQFRRCKCRSKNTTLKIKNASTVHDHRNDRTYTYLYFTRNLWISSNSWSTAFPSPPDAFSFCFSIIKWDSLICRRRFPNGIDSSSSMSFGGLKNIKYMTQDIMVPNKMVGLYHG